MPPPTQAYAIKARPDEDRRDQARSGHGVPSQDPNPAAQFALDTLEAEREGHSVLMAGAMVAGMVAGAAIGVSVAGPVTGNRPGADARARPPSSLPASPPNPPVHLSTPTPPAAT